LETHDPVNGNGKNGNGRAHAAQAPKPELPAGAPQKPSRIKRTAPGGQNRLTLEASPDELTQLLHALRAAQNGDFAMRLPLGRERTVFGQISSAFNAVMGLNETLVNEIVRIERVVGREGRMTERASLGDVKGGWDTTVGSINALIGDLVQPTTEVARVISAVAAGDFTRKMALEIEGQPVKGEFLRIGTTVNQMVDQLSSFAAEVTRVAKEVGTDGKLGGQAEVPDAAGIWRDLTDNVNLLAANLTAQVRNIADVTTAVAKGDLSKKITVDAKGEVLELKNTINIMVDQLNSFAAEVTRVAKEVRPRCRACRASGRTSPTTSI
jgi:HAMP domain-containing protein